MQTLPLKGKRSSGKIASLPPEVRNAVDNMILSCTVRIPEIQAYIQEKADVSVSESTVSRYGKRLADSYRDLMIAQESFESLRKEVEKYPEQDAAEVLLRIAIHKMMVALTSKTDEDWNEMRVDKLMREISGVTRAVAYKQRVDMQNKAVVTAALDDVGAGADSPTQIGFILLGQSRQGHRNARQVDALVAGNRPGNDDLGVHVVAFDLGDLKTNLAVIDENRIASMAIARQALERGGSDMLVALDVVGGDDELLAFGQLDLVFTVGVLLEPTATDLRTLQINQGCDVAAGGLGSGAEVVVDLEVVFRSAVGAVQTSDVHTCFDKAGDAFQGLGSWTDGIYDLGFTHECLPILVDIDFGSDDPVSNRPVY